METVVSDIDGTLLDYDYENRAPAVNSKLLRAWLRRGVDACILVSNQGGIVFGEMGWKRANGKPYPTAKLAVGRLRDLCCALHGMGIQLLAVRYCVFHPRAEQNDIEYASRRMRTEIRRAWEGPFYLRPPADVVVYTTARAYKPEPLMINSAVRLSEWRGGVAAYYGDSDEDEEAARRAGISFVRVPRFTRQEGK